MTLLTSTGCKTYEHVDIRPNEMIWIKLSTDTSTGLNLVNKSILSFTGSLRIKSQNVLNLRSANKQPISAEGVVLFQQQKGWLRIFVWLGAANSLAVELLLDVLLLIAKYIRESFSAEHKIVSLKLAAKKN